VKLTKSLSENLYRWLKFTIMVNKSSL